jgi:hypothetical protein
MNPHLPLYVSRSELSLYNEFIASLSPEDRALFTNLAESSNPGLPVLASLRNHTFESFLLSMLIAELHEIRRLKDRLEELQ